MFKNFKNIKRKRFPFSLKSYIFLKRNISHQKLKIGIIGSAIAGASFACLLRKNFADNVQIKVFEREKNPTPMGAGFLLQPDGIEIVKRIGFVDFIEKNVKIVRLHGETVSKRTVLDLRYKDLTGPYQFGLGVNRPELFEFLHKKMESLEIPLVSGTTISRIDATSQGRSKISTASSQLDEEFDLVVVASGTFAPPPEIFDNKGKAYDLSIQNKRRFKQFPFGALWNRFEVNRDPFLLNLRESHLLYNQYNTSKYMLGLLPTGSRHMTCFWSIDHRNPPQTQKFENWKEEVQQICPAFRYVFNEINLSSWNQLLVAKYADLTMNPFHIIDPANIVFIGDAAHSSSPQLGQGANHALKDAHYLVHFLKENQDIPSALVQFSRVRKPALRFYQVASIFLTPVFQSNSRIVSSLRDNLAYPMHFIPYVYNEALRCLAGQKTGIFSFQSNINH